VYKMVGEGLARRLTAGWRKGVAAARSVGLAASLPRRFHPTACAALETLRVSFFGRHRPSPTRGTLYDTPAQLNVMSKK
jgi:hypothetical protein